MHAAEIGAFRKGPRTHRPLNATSKSSKISSDLIRVRESPPPPLKNDKASYARDYAPYGYNRLKKVRCAACMLFAYRFAGSFVVYE